MKAVIFLNGDAPSDKLLNSVSGTVICADGAYKYLRGKITPSVVLGDFDSVDISTVDNAVKKVIFPPEKDFTDGHIALDYAIKMGATDVDIIGAFGGRPDHAYANLSLLFQAKNHGVNARLISDEWTVSLRNGVICESVSVGAYVSLVPFFDSVHILSTEGLKYPMTNVTLGREHILGISNEAACSRVTVTCEGELLVFIQNT